MTTQKDDTPRRCAYCGKRIDKGKNGRRVYCNMACKQAAWRQRQKEAAARV